MSINICIHQIIFLLLFAFFMKNFAFMSLLWLFLLIIQTSWASATTSEYIWTEYTSDNISTQSVSKDKSIVLKNWKMLELEFRDSSDKPLFAKEVSEKDYKEASTSIKKMASLVWLEYPNQIQDLFDMFSNNDSNTNKVIYSGLPEQNTLAISYLQDTITTKQLRILHVLSKTMHLYLNPDPNTKIEDYTAYQDLIIIRDELKILTMTAKQYATMKNSTVREISEFIWLSRNKYRKEIAESAWISNYRGTREQNMRIKKWLLSVIKVTK